MVLTAPLQVFPTITFYAENRTLVERGEAALCAHVPQETLLPPHPLLEVAVKVTLAEFDAVARRGILQTKALDGVVDHEAIYP